MMSWKYRQCWLVTLVREPYSDHVPLVIHPVHYTFPVVSQVTSYSWYAPTTKTDFLLSMLVSVLCWYLVGHSASSHYVVGTVQSLLATGGGEIFRS